MFRMRKLPGRFKTKNKILLSNMKVICRPTAGRRDQSANHFLPKKMHSLISDTKICGHLPSHRKQTAFPSTQPRIKKETSATSRFPNYTVVQTDRSTCRPPPISIQNRPTPVPISIWTIHRMRKRRMPYPPTNCTPRLPVIPGN